MINIEEFKFDEKGLIVAIAQDALNGEVLMQAFMNKEALQKTLDSGYATYFSRSRQKLWVKGETSGHLQKVVNMKYDCDCDCVVMQVIQNGSACHTGNRSCFYRNFDEYQGYVPNYNIIYDVVNTIKDRKVNPQEGSYTNYLFNKGVEKICKKIGEEATETVIAGVGNKKEELIGELSDLTYHCLVLMEASGIELEDIFAELAKREGLAPNPKYADYNSDLNRNRDK